MRPSAVGSIEKQVHFVHGFDVHGFDRCKRNEENERFLSIKGESFFRDDKCHCGVRKRERGGSNAHGNSIITERLCGRRKFGRWNDFDRDGCCGVWGGRSVRF